MLLPFVDLLRCPAEHEESSLVLSVEAWNGQRIERGVLGCPICHSRYAIVDAIVDFRLGRHSPRSALVAPAPNASEWPARVRRPARDSVASGDSDPHRGGKTEPDIDRLRAQLGLLEPGGMVLLTTGYALAASWLEQEAEVTCLVVDPRELRSAATAVWLGDRVPLATGSVRAAAVDTAHAGPRFLTEVSRVLRGGGRIVAPTGSEPPEGVRVLARDDREWVGEALQGSGQPVIPLRRSARQST